MRSPSLQGWSNRTNPVSFLSFLSHQGNCIRTSKRIASLTTVIWDPAKCAINDEIRIPDYFGLVK